MTDAGWLEDPTGAHELRYHDGTCWTNHVSDAGVASEDPYKPGGLRGIAKVAGEKAAEAKANKQQRTFDGSAVGLARAAAERGDAVFQWQHEVDPARGIGHSTEWVNAICAEGWDLFSTSFVFIERGSSSRDKFLASGQQTAVTGQTTGFYTFKRASS